MATKLTVSGKLDTHRKTHYKFADPERVKKDLENQRRITRLQQVREKSKCLARQLREEVAAEQERQQRNLEKTKKEEQETWREYVVAKKCHDYRTSMFQVGAAHRAAQLETQINEKQKQQRAEKIEKCRRLAAKRSVQYKPTNIFRSPLTRGMNMQGRATASTQTSTLPESEISIGNKLCNKKSSPFSKRRNSCKRKRRTGSSGNHHEKEGEETSSSSDCSESEQKTNEDSGIILKKTPAVIMHVDDESEDSMESCKRDGIDINDLHKATNRKFSRVVRPSTTSSSGLPPSVTAKLSDAIPSRPRFTKISDLVRRTDDIFGARSTQQSKENTYVPPECSSRSSSKSPRKTTQPILQPTSPRVSPSRPAAEPPIYSSHEAPVIKDHPSDAQKRSSLQASNKVIDAGLNRGAENKTSSSAQVNTDSSAKTKTGQSVEGTDAQKSQKDQPMNHNHMYQMHQPPMDPMQMQQMHMLQMPPYMHPHPMYGPQMVPPFNMMPYSMPPFPVPTTGPYVSQSISTSQLPVPTDTAATSASSKKLGGTSNTTGRVQFYDHNNKYFRNYKASEQFVQINPQNSTNRNAMENARIETEMNQQREQEKNCMREIANERGKKALEREQIRRHCAELEEKLEALTQNHSQLLPRDGNLIPSHRFADLALRREQKMNSALEEMLLRPAIVTCPEITVTKNISPRKGQIRDKSSAAEAINVGDPLNKLDDAASTASGSILLDYVNDQSNQLRTELKGMQSNTEKCIKLKSLLQRIEKIRAQLLAELEAGDVNKNGNAQKVIDSIRKERATINMDNASVMNQRELELQKKEELLEQRLRLLYKQQKKCDDKENGKRKKDDTPVEIIIKVKSDGTIKQCIPKEKCQEKSKVNSVENKAVPTSQSPSGVSEKQPTATEATASTQRTPESQRQDSIDSNSTSYRELPPVNYKNIKPAESVSAQPHSLHPVVAHYVDRLLGMSRSSVEKLCVSTSDVPTPSDSLINSPRNISSDAEVNATLIDNQRVARVQAFIEENRCFVDELEDTLRNQQRGHDALQQETSENRPTFEEVWDNQNKQQAPQPQQKQQQPQEKEPKQKSQEKKKVEIVTTSSRSASVKTAVSMPPQEVSASSRSTAQSVTSRPKTEQGKQNQATLTTRTTEIQKQRTVEISSVSGGTKSQVSPKECAARQMERYAELTENCTQRIAELTELITKVREEKQRLVEVTLTSASEGDRQSTEYLELPNLQVQEKTIRSRTASERSESHSTSVSHSDALPLQKNKPTGASLDSGISISRPLTALGQEPPEAEPISLPPASQCSSLRRAKLPPATIRRYSPQLAVEEQTHELSTITEVDTPGQSHMVCATPAAIPFPTFEEYAQEIHLDMSHIDADRSMRLQHVFEKVMLAIKNRGRVVDYREFPSISAYLNEMTASTIQVHVETDENSLQAEEILKRMRVPHVSIREFPSRREYVQRLLENEPVEQRELIDSASLESSDSFNVEAELRERQLLKSSFRREQMSSVVHDLAMASSTLRESAPPPINAYTPNESGVEPLSRSPGRIEGNERTDMQRAGSRPQKNAKNVSGCATSPDHQRSHRITGDIVDQELYKSSADTPQDVSQIGRSLNLREFLTKELLKHRISHKSAESSDDSLKSNFLQSIINSLSPSAPTYGQAANGTNDRQKTSTPVGSYLSTQENSVSVRSDDTQLFSGESRLSAVDYADGTPPVPYDHQQASPTGKSSAFRSSKIAGYADRSKRK